MMLISTALSVRGYCHHQGEEVRRSLTSCDVVRAVAGVPDHIEMALQPMHLDLEPGIGAVLG